ncbi:MAG: NAD(P)-dependent oxidoreductase [Candidatus Omnitrophica bacterium]|nr:NAD(P)-dependent oxidoreductase [Candidatus Omnitrophota bacterium]
MLKNPLVIVTGCSGFLGKNLINELATKEVDVLGIDKAAEDGYGHKNIKINRLDILTQNGMAILRRYLNKVKNKEIYLVHLMGIPDVDECEKNKALAYDVNVKSVKSVWELARNYNMKKIVFPSTALVYGTKYEDQINEGFSLFPENTYAREKLEAENYLINNSAGSKVDSVILRLSNIYGVGMNENNVVNTILKQFAAGYLRLREYRSVRDYVYVEDVIRAFIMSIFSECKFKVYNVGSSMGYSVWELAKTIAVATGREKIILGMNLSEEEIRGSARLVLCCDRIKNDLKWVPDYNFESGIKRMMNA